MFLRRCLGPPRRSLSSLAKYEHILTERKGNVGLITLNRPKAMNALCNGLMQELICAAKGFDQDDSVGMHCDVVPIFSFMFDMLRSYGDYWFCQSFRCGSRHQGDVDDEL